MPGTRHALLPLWVPEGLVQPAFLREPRPSGLCHGTQTKGREGRDLRRLARPPRAEQTRANARKHAQTGPATRRAGLCAMAAPGAPRHPQGRRRRLWATSNARGPTDVLPIQPKIEGVEPHPIPLGTIGEWERIDGSAQTLFDVEVSGCKGGCTSLDLRDQLVYHAHRDGGVLCQHGRESGSTWGLPRSGTPGDSSRRTRTPCGSREKLDTPL